MAPSIPAFVARAKLFVLSRAASQGTAEAAGAGGLPGGGCRASLCLNLLCVTAEGLGTILPSVSSSWLQPCLAGDPAVSCSPLDARDSAGASVSSRAVCSPRAAHRGWEWWEKEPEGQVRNHTVPFSQISQPESTICVSPSRASCHCPEESNRKFS